MGRFHSYINSAAAIIAAYRGSEPLSAYLKKYFASNKKYGSRDRKQVSHLCYCYFRAARLFNEEGAEEKLVKGLFLCSNEPNEILEALKPEWNKKTGVAAREKLLIFNCPILISAIFPWGDELSEGIDQKQFSKSFLVQPDLFIRVRPGYKESVPAKLKTAGVPFVAINEHCLALPNTFKLEDVIALNKEAVIQDYSSQKVGEFLGQIGRGTSGQLLKVWDCCAASGGKSILVKDILGDIDLTVSDVRESILFNLRKRFKEAGIENYKPFVADLNKNKSKIANLKSQIIIADVPCTGSGTWARTPEQLYYFDKKTIGGYSSLQREIISNVIPHLQPGGHLLYITCSVFKKENEEIMEFIKQNFHFELIKMEVLKGYDKKADTMFAALLRKPL
jgi:16S rRNA (cytosine967-C5)-methyltransferase